MTAVALSLSSSRENANMQESSKNGKSPKRRKKSVPSGFSLGGAAKEMHGHPIYCIKWSTDLYEIETVVSPTEEEGSTVATNSSSSTLTEIKDVSSSSSTTTSAAPTYCHCFATCAGNHVTIYEDTPNGINIRQVYKDVDDDEMFYICAFGGHGIGSAVDCGPTSSYNIKDGTTTILLPTKSKHDNDESSEETTTSTNIFQLLADLKYYDGPQLLCVAGKRGVIKIIDTCRRALLLTLSGHGDEIYDLKFSPTNPWLLVSASKDESLRLWNVQTATCVAIFAGHNAHRDSVLYISWHPSGKKFASCGMDTSVKVWSVTESTIQNAIEKSYSYNTISKRGSQQNQDKDESCKKTSCAAFPTLYEQIPIFSTNQMHTDYVDCVQFIGDLLISKSTTNLLALWKTGTKNGVIPLRDFPLTNCDVWFVRFHTDPLCQMLAIGNTKGEIKIWEIDHFAKKKAFVSLTHSTCTSTIRMVSFSPDGKTLLACCDDSSVWKWNANP